MTRTIYVFTARGLAEAASAREVPPDAQVPPGLLISLGDGSAIKPTNVMLKRAFDEAVNKRPDGGIFLSWPNFIAVLIQQAQESR